MKKQLVAIPAVWCSRRRQSKTCQCGKVVRESLRCDETDRVPTRIAYIFDSERLKIPRAKSLVMLSTLIAVHVIGEMVRARTLRESLLNCRQDLSIG